MVDKKQILNLVKKTKTEFESLVESTSKYIKAFKEFHQNHLCLSVEEADLLKNFKLDKDVENTKEIMDLENKIIGFNKRHRKVKK